MTVASSLVDWQLLGQAILTAVVFGLGVLLVAGLAVACSLRAQDARASDDEVAFVGFSAVTVIGVVGIVAAIVGGIWGHGAVSPAGAGSGSRPVTGVLDLLRARLDRDSFDAALFSLETVAATDLGYGDIRALPGSVSWIDRVAPRGRQARRPVRQPRAVSSALELAGIDHLFDEVTVGADTAPTLRRAIDAIGVAAERTVVASATASGVVVAREAGASYVIGVARGISSPEDLRQAGADTVVADLLEMRRAVT